MQGLYFQVKIALNIWRHEGVRLERVSGDLNREYL